MTITLLRANGHPEAGRYPLGRAFMEAWLVRKLQRKQMAGAAAVFNLTVQAMFSKKGSEAAKQFAKYISEA